MKSYRTTADHDITAAVSVQRLAESRSVKLTRKGSTLTGKCPFHPSKGDTLVIDPKVNTWSCKGRCRVKNGDAIAWVMKAEGVSRAHAVELVKNDNFTSTKVTKSKRSTVKKLDAFVPVGSTDDVVMSRVVEFYADALRSSTEAKDYLRSRKLDNAELVEHFRLGYSGRALGYTLPEKNRRAGAALRGQLTRLGVFRESGHEHLAGSLVVPILDGNGGVVDLSGRKITAGLRAGTPQHLTLGDAPRGIINLDGIKDATEVVLCKSVLDALSLWVSGHKNVTATFGMRGFTEQHREALAHVGKVIIAFERSKLGDAATEELGDLLAREGKQVFRVVLPWGQDPNDFLRAGGNFDELLRTAQWMGGNVAGRTSVPTTIAETRESGVGDAVVDEPPAPPPAKVDQDIEVNGTEIVMKFGPRTWRVRGHESCTSLASIRINIRVATDYGFFSDTLDVLAARARASFIKQAREELEIEERILKADLGRVLLHVEGVVDTALRDKLQPTKVEHVMADADREAALGLLRDPRLIDRIVEDFDRVGIVGEQSNKLIGYLATVSRRLDEPLAVVIQSSSAAGKSSLMDAILRFVPEEEQVSYSAMTGQSLYYLGSNDLQHKVLAISEEAGVTQAAYALRVLQSAGHLTIASTGKDQQTGRLATHEYKVQGPVAIMMTTASASVDEELLNRCVVVSVDEGPEQTKAIHAVQRHARTLEGLLAKADRIAIENLHRNAQRLLEPIHVVNPYATDLGFTATTTRARRDQKKYLGLIDAIALLHQHLRQHKTVERDTGSMKYIEVVRSDIELADRLIGHLLTQATEDMPPQTSRMLHLVRDLVSSEADKHGIDGKDVRFTRRMVRERMGWTEKQTRVHLGRLLDLEHVVRYRAAAGQHHLYGLAATPTMPTLPRVAQGLPSHEGQGFHEGQPEVNSALPTFSEGMYRGNGSEKSYRTRSSQQGR